MKISYNREDDVLMYELSDAEIEYAEEIGPIIIHFDKYNKPVLLEILDASNFLAETTKVTMKATRETFIDAS
jgi:hypothetical protein